MAESKKNRKIYLQQDVLTAARERMAFVFGEFASIAVGVSGGKDSTVLAHLALSEARRRKRQIALYFVDAEMIHQAVSGPVYVYTSSHHTHNDCTHDIHIRKASEIH